MAYLSVNDRNTQFYLADPRRLAAVALGRAYIFGGGGKGCVDPFGIEA
jgi:hypothetical protein